MEGVLCQGGHPAHAANQLARFAGWLLLVRDRWRPFTRTLPAGFPGYPGAISASRDRDAIILLMALQRASIYPQPSADCFHHS